MRDDAEVARLDDRLLKLARSARRRYGLLPAVIEDLKQIGWVIHLETSGDPYAMAKCFFAMLHACEIERNGYRLNGKNKHDGQRYLYGVDLTEFPSPENLEARAAARHELGKIYNFCAARHVSYLRTLESFIRPVPYTASLNERRLTLRKLLRKRDDPWPRRIASA